MAKTLKGLVRAAAQADLCPFKPAQGRIEVNTLHVRKIGRRLDGQYILALVCVMGTRNDNQLKTRNGVAGMFCLRRAGGHL